MLWWIFKNFKPLLYYLSSKWTFLPINSNTPIDNNYLYDYHYNDINIYFINIQHNKTIIVKCFFPNKFFLFGEDTSLFKIWRNENWIKLEGRFLHKARGISLRQVTPRNYLLSRKWPACASTWLGRPFSTSPLHPLQLNPPTIKSIKHAPFMPISLASNTLLFVPILYGRNRPNLPIRR